VMDWAYSKELPVTDVRIGSSVAAAAPPCGGAEGIESLAVIICGSVELLSDSAHMRLRVNET
jgi:hypothetical protein